MKPYVAFVGILLLVLHLSTQVVHGQNTTDAPANATDFGFTVTPATTLNITGDKNAFSRISTPLLLPLALALVPLLHSWV